MNTQKDVPEGYTTPTSLVVGWLLAFFSTTPILIGVSDPRFDLRSVILGLFGLLVSLGLIAIGQIKKNRLLRTLRKKTDPPSL